MVAASPSENWLFDILVRVNDAVDQKRSYIFSRGSAHHITLENALPNAKSFRKITLTASVHFCSLVFAHPRTPRSRQATRSLARTHPR